MVRFYILPVLALIGIIFVLRTVIAGSIPPPVDRVATWGRHRGGLRKSR